MAARKKKTRASIPPGSGRAGLANARLKDTRKGRRRQNDVRLDETFVRMAEAQSENYFKTFQRNIDFYVGKQNPGFTWDWEIDDWDYGDPTEKRIVVNRILAVLASQNAQIMWQIPWFNLHARRASGLGDDEQREAAEHALNYVLQAPKNNFLLHARLTLLMAHFGVGFLKHTYVPDLGIDPEKDKPEQLGEVAYEVDPLTGEERIEFVGGTPKLRADGTPIRRGRTKFVVDNRNPADYFRTDWVHFLDMRIDPEGANDLQEHQKIGERMSWTLEEFEAVEFFEHKKEITNALRFVDRDGLSRNTRARLEGSNAAFNPAEPLTLTPNDRHLSRIWGTQIWDLKKREIRYIVDGFDKLVGKMPFPPYIETSPYSDCKIHEVPGEYWPITEIEAARPLALGYNEMWSGLLTHFRRFKRKYISRFGMLDESEKAKLADPDDGVVVEFRKGNRTDIGALEDAPLDPAIYRMMARFIDDMSEILGNSPEARGIADSDTATQAAIIERSGTARDNDKRATVARCLERHAKITLDSMQYNMDERMQVNITGPRGTAFEGRLSRLQIQGDFKTRIDLTELEPHDLAAERQELGNIVSLLGPAAFLAPTFSKRFFTAHRFNDPQMVVEFQQVAAMLVGQQEGPGPGSQGGPKQTGQGPEGNRFAEGRSNGRTARTSEGNG